jgi:Protein of unknown function (DUF4058)
MPVHDWTRVDQCFFYSYAHSWVVECARALNRCLPREYYALIALRTAPHPVMDDDDPQPIILPELEEKGRLIFDPPAVELTAESADGQYRRRKNVVDIHHVGDDRVVAKVELVSPCDKASHRGMREFVGKVADQLEKGVHVLVVDLHAPGPRDPHGIHVEIWEEFAGHESRGPDKPFVTASYDADLVVRAFVETVAMGEELPAMPLFVERGAHIVVPLEAIYRSALEGEPRHILRVLEAR